MDQDTRTVVYFYPVINAQTWRQRRRKYGPAVGRPFTVRCIGCIDGANLSERSTIEDVEFTGEITKTRQCK